MNTDVSLATAQFLDGQECFTTTVLTPQKSTGVCLFAVGRGGNPLRHLSLLQTVASRGFTVVAPHLAMLAGSVPTKQELDTRIRRLERALEEVAPLDQPITGIGHSIGTVVLLALAGAQARTLSGHLVVWGSKWTFSGLALMAPPADFFRHPSALQSIYGRMYIRAGGQDRVTPPTQAMWLSELLAKQTQVAFRLDEEAGHFSYMGELPPQVVDSQPNRTVFLASLAEDVAEFIASCH